MWLSFHVEFDDGQESHRTYFRLWIPSTNPWATLYLRVDIRFYPETQAVTGNLRVNHRRGQEHGDGDEPEIV
jgi:hypothetical protein